MADHQELQVSAGLHTSSVAIRVQAQLLRHAIRHAQAALAQFLISLPIGNLLLPMGDDFQLEQALASECWRQSRRMHVTHWCAAC